MSKIDEIIKKNNRAWNKAGKREKKLMICQDVLSMLRSPKYYIITGTYCSINDREAINNAEPETIQGNFIENKISCVCCARGALMISKFRFANDLFGNEIVSQTEQSSTRQALEEAFTSDELDLIESIFEQDTHFSEYWTDAFDISDSEEEIPDGINNETSVEHLKVMKTFSRDDKTRLKQIMERIISCNGNVKKALTCPT